MNLENNKYSNMQKSFYNDSANSWTISNRDPVVGYFDNHNEWKDYELLFDVIENQSEKIGLDFGCGPGRNIVKYKDRFSRLDGVDISENNIRNAKIYLNENGINNSKLYINNGFDLFSLKDNSYDFVMSTICLQHICVYSIRYNLMKEIYRVLKNGGIFTAQMGYGYPSPQTVNYFDDYFDANVTNRGCDVCVSDHELIKSDLVSIGFNNKTFSHKITNVGPGDVHPNWIFFNIQKI